MKQRLCNKKGVTLVELLMVMLLSVLIAGAACGAFYTAAQSAAKGTDGYRTHGQAQLLEQFLQNHIPCSTSLSSGAEKGASNSPQNFRIYFQPDGSLIVEKQGKEFLALTNIEEFSFYTESAGKNQTFYYTIRAKENRTSFKVTGGIALNNLKGLSIKETMTPKQAQKQYFLLTAQSLNP